MRLDARNTRYEAQDTFHRLIASLPLTCRNTLLDVELQGCLLYFAICRRKEKATTHEDLAKASRRNEPFLWVTKSKKRVKE